MSNDFQSLLSTFQAATGTIANRRATSNEVKKEKSLLELTTQLWQLSKLKQSTQALTSSSSSEKKSPAPPLHLGICLCIVDDFPHEHIWKYWMEQRTNGATAELYLHAKHPDRIRSSWARSKLISVSHRPDWNDIRIVQAMLSLMKEALEDERVTHIVFGTESCIPICPLKDVTLDCTKSYVVYFDKREASRFDERRCWNAVEPNVVSEAIHKALPGWCTLCRSHAQDIINLPKEHLDGKELWPAFRSCWAPEEVFFPTALALLGHLPCGTVRKSLTHAEWNFRAHNERDRAHPKQWDDNWCAGLLQEVRMKHGCLFLRKVKHPMSIEKWKDAVVPRYRDNGSKERHEKRPYRHGDGERTKRQRR